MGSSCIFLFSLRSFGRNATFAARGVEQVNGEGKVNGVCIVIIVEFFCTRKCELQKVARGEPKVVTAINVTFG